MYAFSLQLDVIIGLNPLTTLVRESQTFPVCAQLMSGSLERSITAELEIMNGSAIRMFLYRVYIDSDSVL